MLKTCNDSADDGSRTMHRGEGAWAWTRGRYPNAHWGLIAIAWQCTLGMDHYSMVGEDILPLHGNLIP
jgi:hypothetical protein